MKHNENIKAVTTPVKKQQEYKYGEVDKDGFHYLVILANNVRPDAPDPYGADFVLQFHGGESPTFVVDRTLKEKLISDLLYSWRVTRSTDRSARQNYASLMKFTSDWDRIGVRASQPNSVTES